MKCKKCGAEIPKGELICPICGWKVQLVPDYETVESMLSEKELREKEEKERKEAEAKKAAEEARKRRPKPRVVILKFLIAALGTAAGAYICIGRINQIHASDYVYQKNAAEKAYEGGDYDLAASYAERAALLDPDSANISLLKAEILAANGSSDEAIAALQAIISADPENTDAFEALIKVYEKQEDYNKIAELLNESNSAKLKKKYSDYIVEKPEFSMISGIYPSGTTLKITASSGNIYYTTDGSTPTEKSTLYNGSPIVLSDGKKTTVKAIAINGKGIQSEVVTGVFTIETDVPDAPSVTPDSGTYAYGAQKITVSIPEGCTVYYRIDGTAAAGTGSIYTSPVEMPRGTHIFNAIAQDINGNVSKVTSRTYQVN